MTSMRMPVRFSSAGVATPEYGGHRPAEATRVPKVCFDPIPQISPLTQAVDAQNTNFTKELALIDALQASQAANDALEAVIKLQARAIEQMKEDNKKLCQQNEKLARGKTQSKPVTSEASTEILSDEAALFSMTSTLDASVQATDGEQEVTTVQTALDLPQSSPRIQPPVVPPTPGRRRGQSHTPKGSPRMGAPSELNMEKLTQANASPYVAEAFRLGWLAGVKSNSMATNKAPSSTRSDDSQPSDPGSFVVGSRGSESGGSESRGSVSPGLTPGSVSPGSVSPGSQSPGPSDKLPTLPTMMPPPPPPTLLVPPEIPFEQLG